MTKILIVTFILLISSATYAKECKTGIPCGDTCISKNKICRNNTAEYSGQSSDSKRSGEYPEFNSQSNTAKEVDAGYKIYPSDQSGVDYKVYGAFIVVNGPLDVREFASGDSELLFSLETGTQIQVTGKYRSWYEITYKGGSGFVNSSQLKKIK